MFLKFSFSLKPAIVCVTSVSKSQLQPRSSSGLMGCYAAACSVGFSCPFINTHRNCWKRWKRVLYGSILLSCTSFTCTSKISFSRYVTCIFGLTSYTNTFQRFCRIILSLKIIYNALLDTVN